MTVFDPDPDDIFAQIVAGITLDEPTDTVDYTTLDDVALSKAKQEVRRELFEMDQLRNFNATGRAAELHSKFAAINAEMRKRWPNNPEETP